MLGPCPAHAETVPSESPPSVRDFCSVRQRRLQNGSRPANFVARLPRQLDRDARAFVGCRLAHRGSILIGLVAPVSPSGAPRHPVLRGMLAPLDQPAVPTGLTSAEAARRLAESGRTSPCRSGTGCRSSAVPVASSPIRSSSSCSSRASISGRPRRARRRAHHRHDRRCSASSSTSGRPTGRSRPPSACARR